MKVYGIGTKTDECYGHGDYGKEVHICHVSAYEGNMAYPPLFRNRIKAETYIATLKQPWKHLLVVELELVE